MIQWRKRVRTGHWARGVIQCFILPLNHPVGVAVVAWVQPDSLLVESGRVSDSGLMAFYGYLAEDTRLSQRWTLILANVQSLAWWNVCFKNGRHDECLVRTVEGTTGRLGSSLPLLARAQGQSCGRSVGQEGSPSEETHHVPCWDVWRWVGYTGILLHDWRQKTGSEALWASWAFVFLCLVPQWSACTLSLQGEPEWGKPTSVPLLAELEDQGILQPSLEERSFQTVNPCPFWLASDELRKLAQKARDSRQWRLSSPLHPHGSHHWRSIAPSIHLFISIITKMIPHEKRNPETSVPKTAS